MTGSDDINPDTKNEMASPPPGYKNLSRVGEDRLHVFSLVTPNVETDPDFVHLKLFKDDSHQSGIALWVDDKTAYALYIDKKARRVVAVKTTDAGETWSPSLVLDTALERGRGADYYG